MQSKKANYSKNEHQNQTKNKIPTVNKAAANHDYQSAKNEN